MDDLCFGALLLLTGLNRTAQLALGHNIVYADAWVDELRPDEEQLNRTEAAPIDAAYVARLKGLLDRYLPG